MSTASKSALDIAEIISAQCAFRDTRVLNRRITGWYEDALRPLGLRATQLTLLVAVGVVGPVRPTDLAPALAMEKSTLSRNVDRLLEKGWLETHPTEDGRSRLLVLGREGGEMLEKAMPLWEKAQGQARAALRASGLEILGSLSRKAQLTS